MPLMRNPRAYRRLAGAILLGILGACGLLEPRSEDRLTLYVAPAMAECVGVGPRQCLLVKERPEQEWGYFYGSIAGFAYEPGFTYTLSVARRRVPNPPADGSSYEYRLLRLLAREAAPPR